MLLKVKNESRVIDSRDLISLGKRVNLFVFKNKYLNEFYTCEFKELTVKTRDEIIAIIKDYAPEEMTSFGMKFLRFNRGKNE